MSDITKSIIRKKREVPNLISRDQYFKIWGFMRYDLRLEKAELLIYAVIYNFHQSCAEAYTGSREYLAEWCGCGKTAVDDALRNLCKKKYIIKEIERIGNALRTIYTINTAVLPKCDMFKVENEAQRIAEQIEHKRKLESYGIV